MLKKRNAKDFPFSSFPFSMNFVLEALASTSVLLFPNNAKRSRRITAHIVLLGFSLKKQEKNARKYNLTFEILLSNNTSNR